jgi:tRNA 2-thiouridine synthesizing protein E
MHNAGVRGAHGYRSTTEDKTLSKATAYREQNAGPATRFDESGFLADPSSWTPELARQIAQLDGIGELDDRHWRVIHHVRDRFFRLGGIPAIRLVCRATSVSREEIDALFGGCLAIWRIAGLPDPGEEARAYLG